MLKNALLASALALSVYVLSTNAEAGHRPTEWYVGIEGGVNLVDDSNVVVLPLVTSVRAEFNTGWSVFLDAGYRWENNWRLEFEAGYRQNDVDCVAVGNAPCNGGNWGDISQYTQMVNVVHDIELDNETTLSMGLGLGGDYVKADSPLLHDQDYVFAGQFLLQLSHQISDQLDLVLSYRFMASDSPQFQRTALQSVGFHNDNHTFTIGLRYDLDAPDEPLTTPAPVVDLPPEPPAAPQQFVVYFGFNKANLDARAEAVVADAAATAIHDGFVSILVTGYTDTAGSAAYNERLSVRRAETVKHALAEKGVTEKEITATGKGESVLLVQTSDQAKEARNRRATIDIEGPGQHAEAPPSANTMAQHEPAPASQPAEKPAPVQHPARSGADEDTLAQYHVWIAQARAEHPYADSEEKMFDVMMCESGGKASTVNPAGPYSGLFQYATQTWKGAWNDYRNENILDPKAQIFATALAWQSGLQHQWNCYNHPH